MSTRERLVLYTLLALSLALALGRGSFLDRSASATAPADGGAVPELGPASALLLKGEHGDLTLRNADGRLGWTKDAFGRTYSIGFVHITKPLRKLRDKPKFVEEGEALAQELSAKDESYRKGLEEISAKLRGLDQDSDEFKRVFAEGDALYKEFMAWQQGALERKSKLEATQLELAYREVVDAIDVVAQRLGVDIVYRFIATNDPFEATDMGQALNEIRFRSVLRYPQGLDITPEVAKELGIEIE